MDLHQIACKLLLSWINNFNEPAQLDSLVRILEYKSVISLATRKIESDVDIMPFYASALGIMYADLCKSDTIYKEKCCLPIIANKAYSFLSKIQPTHELILGKSIWDKVTRAQHTILNYLQGQAFVNKDFASMYNYYTQLLHWNYKNYHSLFKDLKNPQAIINIFQKDAVEAIKSLKTFLNTAESKMDSIPELIIPMAALYEYGLTLFLYDKQGKNITVTVISKDEEKALSFYQKGAELNISQAQEVLGDYEKSKGNIDKALQYYAKSAQTLTMFKYMETLIEKAKSLNDVQCAQIYFTEAKHVYNILIKRAENPKYYELLPNVYALSTHYDIDEQDQYCPYIISQKLKNIFYSARHYVSDYLDYLNPKIYPILKNKAEELMKKKDLTQEDTDLLSFFVFTTMANDYHNASNSKEDKILYLTKNMKYILHAAKHNNYIAKYLVGLCLYENSVLNNTAYPIQFFKNLYEVITQTEDKWSQQLASHDLINLAHKGNIIAQAMCLMDEALSLPIFFKKCPASPQIDEQVHPDTSNFLIEIISESRMQEIRNFVQQNPNIIAAKTFLLKMNYALGIGTLNDPQSNKIHKQLAIINLKDAYAMSAKLLHIFNKKEDKELLINLMKNISKYCEIHGSQLIQEMRL
jgi:TPR repeat protein